MLHLKITSEKPLDRWPPLAAGTELSLSVPSFLSILVPYRKGASVSSMASVQQLSKQARAAVCGGGG